MRTWSIWCIALIPVTALGMVDVDLVSGRANLEIRFTNDAPEIVAYLAAHPVVTSAWVEAAVPVRLHHVATGELAASAAYADGSPPLGPSATAVLLPPVEAGGSGFLASVNPLLLSGGAEYRFGSTRPGSPSAIVCGPVLPSSDDPDGFDCEVSECASLIRLQLSAVGDVADLAGLDASESVTCSASGWVEEIPYSNSFVPQSGSEGAVFGLDALLDGSAALSLLVRADGSRVRVDAACWASVKPGEVGFVLSPGSRRTPLGFSALVTPVCDGVVDVAAPLPVERTAGVLEGLFDISTRTETWAEVRFEESGRVFIAYPPSVPAAELPSPGSPWVFEGAPSTSPTSGQDLFARALVDDSLRYLELPHRSGLNGPVEVTVAQQTDVGSTFVSRPHTLVGDVVLTDRGSGLGLENVSSNAFGGLPSPGVWSYAATSFVQAVGRPELAPGGGSGVGAVSRSVLIGDYSAETGESRLSYELLLGGLSAVVAPLDGTGARPTPWLLNGVNAYFDLPGGEGWQVLQMEIGELLPYTTPSWSAPGTLPAPPELHLCVGRVGFTIRTDPTVARLYGPRVSAWNGQPILTIPADPHSLFLLRQAYTVGAPRTIEGRTDSLEVSAILPAGARYRVSPWAWLTTPAGENPTYLSVPSLDLPLGGLLQCGEETHPCVTTTADGVTSQLAIGVDPPVPACLESGDLTWDVVFDSDAPVTSLVLTVDEEPPESLCSPCTQPDGSTPPVTVSRTLPADGQIHSLTLVAEDAAGCSAPHEMSVLVPEHPLTLQCAQDFVCVVPASQTSLAADDDCVASGLSAPVADGGCQYPTALSDDRPDVFPLGSTPVVFTAIPGEATCTTDVTLIQEPDYQLAYAMGESVRVRDVGTGLYQMVAEAPAGVEWLEFDALGERLAVALAATNPSVVVYEVDTGSQLLAISSHPIGDNVQFDPQDSSRLAVVLRSPNPPVSYWVALYRNAQNLATVRLQQEPFMSRPEIDWSQDGKRLLAIVTYPVLTGTGDPLPEYRVRLEDWDVAGSGLANPTDWVRTRGAPREEPVEIIYYLTPGAGAFGSQRGISKAGGTDVVSMSAVPNLDIDMTRDVAWAAVLLARPEGAELAVVRSPGSGLTPDIDGGPTLDLRGGVKPRVAISDDGARIAVSRSDSISVFRYPGFEELSSFDAQAVRYMRFRPASSLAAPQAAGASSAPGLPAKRRVPPARGVPRSREHGGG